MFVWPLVFTHVRSALVFTEEYKALLHLCFWGLHKSLAAPSDSSYWEERHFEFLVVDGEAGPEASLCKCTLGVCSETSPCNYTQWVCLFGCFCFFGAARKTRLNEISIYFELLFFCLFLCGWRGVDGDGGCKRFIRAGDKWFWKCSDALKHKLTLTFWV